jgi:hypothetical protein
MKRNVTLLACLLAGSLLGGCGSNDSDGVLGGTGGLFGGGGGPALRTLTINEPNFPTRDGDVVDTVEVEGFDATGRMVFGPVRVPRADAMSVSGVPDSVVSLELDYLRNGSFVLFRAHVPVVNGVVAVKDPAEVPVALQDTHFDVQSNGNGGFSLLRTFSGAQPSEGPQPVAAKVEPLKFKIKGVCYSPAPINSTNQKGNSLGDLFWDSIQIKYTGGSDWIYGWSALWDSFFAQGVGTDGNSRADLAKIRQLGCNTIRVYSLLAYQQGSNGELTNPDDPKTVRFQHKAFLDKCWDGGPRFDANGKQINQPLHVIIDIPMPDSAFQYAVRFGLFTREANAGNPNVDQLVAADVARYKAQVEWWERNLRAIVEDTHNHPAVLGYNIMNEKGGDRPAHPNGGNGQANQETDYFWGQAVKYADMIKAIDDTKLVGWAYHDSPAMVHFGSRQPADGPKYLERLTSFDYWGINSYQSKSLDSVAAPGFFGSYRDLPASMQKPVLFTEMGWPAATHEGGVQTGKLVESVSAQEKVADVIKLLFPKIFEDDIYMGVCYFEFTDEWWKQGPDFGPVSDAAWDGGNVNTDRPNGFNDEEAFGLYSISRQGGRPNNDRNYVTFPDKDPSLDGTKGPKQPYDKITPRQPMIDALKAIYARF